jgi:hypothetical protein
MEILDYLACTDSIKIELSDTEASELVRDLRRLDSEGPTGTCQTTRDLYQVLRSCLDAPLDETLRAAEEKFTTG